MTDPFEPIQVDPPSESPPESQGKPAPVGDRDATSRTRLDPADHALGAAQTLLILNAIDQRTDAAMAGGAEVAGASTAAAAAGDFAAPAAPMDMGDDPLDDPGADDAAVANGSDGCAGGSFAFLLMLTAAAGTALALAR